MGYISSVLYVRMQTKMGYDLNIKVVRHVQNLSLSYINKNENDSAYLSQRINSDANSLIIFCITVLQSIITNVIMFVVPLVILLSMNWFTAVLLMGFLVVYMVLYAIFKKPLYKANFALKEAQSKFFALLFEQLKYIKLIKINGIQPEINKRADKGFGGLKEAVVHNQKVGYLYSGLDGFITTLAQITLFITGGIQILSGNFTIGMFTIFSSYFNMMIGAARYFFNLGASYQQTLVAYNRITEILEQKTESKGNKILDGIQSIALNNLTFGYDADNGNDNSNKKIIENFNVTFSKGKIYGIAGANGAGKSTLINLLLGLYSNEYQGNVSYNGINIQNIDMPQARKILFGFAEQEPMLINDTIRYNLTYGLDDRDNSREKTDKTFKTFSDSENKALIDVTQIAEYLQILNMDDFINKNSLELIINDKNSNTSGGEKQKISILKVLLKSPPVMIFDEPTSALDAETTGRFIEYLRKIKKDRIIILITHDDFVKGACDEIIPLGSEIL